MSAKELKNRMGMIFRLGAIILLVGLMVIAALRIFHWNAGGASRRVLTLVNPWNPLSETGYTPKLTKVENGFLVDKACARNLERMLSDCRASGRQPVLLGAYRSVDEQLVLYDEEVQRLVEAGKSPEEAESEASRKIAQPGRSEHELGLSIDLADIAYTELDETQSTTQTAQWMNENAWRYGFILRYPRGAEAITGYGWPPWHYRYVGGDAAANIWALGITLEEYLSMFYSEEAAVEVTAA